MAQSSRSRVRLDPKRLDRLIREATVDCHDEQEAASGFFVMIEDHLELPFETKVFAMAVSVESLESDERGAILAICQLGGVRQAIRLLDLPLPSPPPGGFEWIEAYRRWERES